MQQLTCTGPGAIEWREVPEPTLEDDAQALVRPLAVARCDIDLLLSSGAFPSAEPFALGHECVGEIVALGDRVRGLEVGQRVAVSFQVSCGACASCSAGHTATCDRVPVLSDYGMRPLSGVEYGGMLSDRIRVPFAEAMLRPLAPELDPVALASMSDNVLDGYRAVAPHLADRPGAGVLIVAHGLSSIPLYAAQASLALGAARVDFASADPEALRHAERLGATPLATNFSRSARQAPIVVDAGLSREGLAFSIRSTLPEGVCQCVGYYPGADTALPLGRMYTLGIRFFVGRCHAAALLPEVMRLVEAEKLRPQDVTTRVVDWAEAERAWLEPATKLVVRRSIEAGHGRG